MAIRPFAIPPLALAALVVLCAAPAFSAEPNTGGTGGFKWRVIGPGSGGANFAVAIHPTDPKIMLAGTDMGCLYRTEDAGKSWTIVGSWGNGQANPGYRGAWSALFDPKRPSVAWAASEHAVCKSLDAGKTWRRMTASLGGKPLAFQGVALDPTDSDIVYICQGWAPRGRKSWSHGRVWKSVSGGKSWRELPRPGGPLGKDRRTWARNYTNLLVDPNSLFVKGRGHARVFLFGVDGLYVSENAGASWTSLADKLPNPHLNDMVIVNRKGKSLLFVTVRLKQLDPKKRTWVGGVYRSDDLGKTWVERNRGQEKRLSRMARYNGRFTVMLAHSPAAPRRLYSGAYFGGVYQSDDLGESWRQITHPGSEWLKATDPAGQTFHYHLTRKGGNFTSAYSPGVSHFMFLTTCASNADYIAFTDNYTTFLTRNGGKTWEGALCEYGEPFDKGRFGARPPMKYTHKRHSRGPQMIVAHDVAVDPFDPKTFVLSYSDIGLHITRDGGLWWEVATRGVWGSRGVSTQSRAVVFDPSVKGRLYASMGRAGCIFESADTGRTFRPIHGERLRAIAERHNRRNPRNKLAVYALAVDPSSPPDARTLYAATPFGVYKLADGAKDWEDCSYGLGSAHDIRLLKMDPKQPEILYAGCSYRSRAKAAHGLYRTMDGGKNWVRLGPKRIGAVRSFSICAKRPETLYAVANEPGKVGSVWHDTRLWRSDDRGETWRMLSKLRGDAVGVCPTDPNRVYFGTYAQDLNAERVALLRSTDGGKTWKDIGLDMPLSRPRSFHFDPKDPARFFLLDSFCVYECRDGEVGKR